MLVATALSKPATPTPVSAPTTAARSSTSFDRRARLRSSIRRDSKRARGRDGRLTPRSRADRSTRARVLCPEAVEDTVEATVELRVVGEAPEIRRQPAQVRELVSRKTGEVRGPKVRRRLGDHVATPRVGIAGTAARDLECSEPKRVRVHRRIGGGALRIIEARPT